MFLGRKPAWRHHLLSALILTFILRMSLPQVRYVYYPLFILLVVHFLVSKPHGDNLKRVVRQLIPFFILLGVFLAASLYHTAFLRPYIEVINAFELAVILILLFYAIGEGMPWNRFRNAFVHQLFILAVVTALVGLGRITYALMGGDLNVEEGESLVSVASDYNFFVLALLYGVISGVYKLWSLSDPGQGRIVLYNAAILAMVAGMVMVPSRRGALILVLFILGLVIIRLVALFAGSSLKLTRIRRLDYLLTLLLLAGVGLNIFLFHTSNQFKERLLTRTGLYRMDLRSRLTDTWHRYGRMVDRDLGFREVYMHLWMNEADGREERTLVDQSFAGNMGGFSKKGHARVKILYRSGNAGCLAIRASDPDQGVTRDFYVDVGDTVEVTAMIRVIQWSRHLGIAIPDRDNRELVYAKPEKHWQGDGQWHPIRLKVAYDVFGSLPVWMGGGSSPDSSSLSCWSRIHIRRVGSARGSTPAEQTHPSYEIKKTPPGLSDTLISRMLPSVNKKADHEQGTRYSCRDRSDKPAGSGISSALPDYMVNALLEDFPDDRVLESSVRDLEGPFPDNRSGRWKLARQIFENYTFAEKLTGKGFTWLPLYGAVFYDNPRYYDYPHNPVISVVLYSGVIGGLLYLAYLAGALMLYVKYRRHYGFFLVLFLLTGIFVSVSGNSHFSVPAFAFFTHLPFFFAYIERNKISRDQ